MPHEALSTAITTLQKIRSIVFLLATDLLLLIFVVGLFRSLFHLCPHLPREDQAVFEYNFAIAIKILTTCAVLVYPHGKEELSLRLAWNLQALAWNLGVWDVCKRERKSQKANSLMTSYHLIFSSRIKGIAGTQPVFLTSSVIAPKYLSPDRLIRHIRRF
jgi:hypothetical protein